MEDKIEKITIDDQDFYIADLPDELKQLVAMYEETYAKVKELAKQQQVLNFAIQQMGVQLVAGIRALNEQGTPPQST